MRTKVLGIVVLSLLMGVFRWVPRVSAQASDYFTLAIIPDTQAYTLNDENNVIFQRQIDWILNNQTSHKIAYALHEGDMTEHNTPAEWQRFASQMKRLNGLVPYALTLGNHDVAYDYSNQVANYANFYQTFPYTEFRQANPNHKLTYEAGKLENSYYEFSAGGRDWGIITLEWETRPAVLAWANSVVQQHPERLFIILLHAYMYHDNNPSNPYPMDPAEVANTRYGQVASATYQWHPYITSGETIWRDLASKQENILFVFSGHTLGTGTGRRVDTGRYGNQVYQMLANYQMYGDGSLRLIYIYPTEQRFEVKTYSPFRGSYRSDQANEFGYTNVRELSGRRLGDYNNDRKIDNSDRELVITKYRNPYTLFDYNLVVRNFGK